MTREIKFRAWDEDAMTEYDQQQMYSWEDLEQFRMYDIMHPNNFVFMQSTGLRDKLGREIFESDIVRPYRSARLLVVRWHDILGWDLEIPGEGAVKLDKLMAHKFPERKHWDTDLTIVGNIYENRNLIK